MTVWLGRRHPGVDNRGEHGTWSVADRGRSRAGGPPASVVFPPRTTISPSHNTLNEPMRGGSRFQSKATSGSTRTNSGTPRLPVRKVSCREAPHPLLPRAERRAKQEESARSLRSAPPAWRTRAAASALPSGRRSGRPARARPRAAARAARAPAARPSCQAIPPRSGPRADALPRRTGPPARARVLRGASAERRSPAKIIDLVGHARLDRGREQHVRTWTPRAAAAAPAASVQPQPPQAAGEQRQQHDQVPRSHRGASAQ